MNQNGLVPCSSLELANLSCCGQATQQDIITVFCIRSLGKSPVIWQLWLFEEVWSSKSKRSDSELFFPRHMTWLNPQNLSEKDRYLLFKFCLLYDLSWFMFAPGTTFCHSRSIYSESIQPIRSLLQIPAVWEQHTDGILCNIELQSSLGHSSDSKV